jgi:hypothetical protein
MISYEINPPKKAERGGKAPEAVRPNYRIIGKNSFSISSYFS